MESGRRVTWWTRRRCTVPSHCPSLLAICANCRFFRMPCWCLAQLQPHPGSLHVSDRGCFQCPQLGQRTCDGGLTRGFPPDPAPLAPSPSPLDPRATSRSIDARARVGRDGALAFDKFSRPARSPCPAHVSRPLASSCARCVRLRSLLARGESIERTRARRGGKPTSAWASSPCRKVRARRPFPGALSPARATAAAAPKTKGGIPLSAGRETLSDAPMTSPAELTFPPRPDAPTTQSQRRRGCAP